MRTLKTLRSGLGRFVLGVSWLAMAACLASALLVAADALLRKLSDVRISVPGSSELSAMLLVVMCMLSIPAYQVKDGHVSVRLLTDRLPAGTRRVWMAAVLGAECAVSLLFTVAAARKLRMFWETGTTTDVLGLPKWPFALAALLGFAEMTGLLGLDACLTAGGEKGQNFSQKRGFRQK